MAATPAGLSIIHCARLLMDNPLKPDSLSWRDPDGFVVHFRGKIFRAVSKTKSEQSRALSREAWVLRLIANGEMPETVEVSPPQALAEYGDQFVWLEHAALTFPCYPLEITALQLYDSAVLTIKIAILALQNGWMLKDASAWNVLHSRGKPVFVDFLSFEPRSDAATWLAYGQFARHFLLPLLLYKKLGMTPSEVFLSNRDGITPERAYQLLGGCQVWSRVALEFVLLPKWLTRAGTRLVADENARRPRRVNAEMSQDLILRTFRRLERMVKRLRPAQSGRESLWENYEEGRGHYTHVDLASKRDFVRQHLQGSFTVLDIGCNAGEFSLLAEEGKREVVAADLDHSAVSRLYSRIRGQTVRVTPLMLNIARPTPAVGWENRETASFLERARGKFDCLLALGLVHHLLASERATLPQIVDLFYRLSPKRVIVEWIDPSDPKFIQVAGFNMGLYSELSAARFEESFSMKFALVAKMPLPCTTRVMYLWTRAGTAE